MQLNFQIFVAIVALLVACFRTKVGALPIRIVSPTFRIPFLDQVEGKRRDHSVTNTLVTGRQIHGLPPYPPIKRDSNNTTRTPSETVQFNATQFSSEPCPAGNELAVLLEQYRNKTMSAGEALKMLECFMNYTSIIVDAGRLLPVSPENW